MNMFKSNGGFTLVELIVVIAILAILAGVAVPAYSGYINKAKAVQDDALIASCETGLNSAAAYNGTINPTVTIAVENGTATFTFAAGAEKIAQDFASFVNGGYDGTNAPLVVTVSGFKNTTSLTYLNGELD